ncbi:hypothetical protein BW247_12720 [Acidihalobacter ferrooxydans]|uniref:DUF3987 domain-containing protein n=1 Tax=Acidihalobacter ferrooxydans TaxID=1765967 RepID=A0A1P8ULS2_9GAMM|nr:hypothetical protein BW247_12720 [Acidihalobacter ferrooxydans]
MPPVEKFDLALLPESLREACGDAAHRMQCPPDFVAVGYMVAASSAVGRIVGIKPKRRDDWLVAPNLWGCVVGRPSALKTPALSEALRPLKALEAKAREQFAKERRQFETALQLHELKMSSDRKKAAAAIAKGNTAEAENILLGSGTEPEAPTCRRFIVNDTTVEKLGELLAENPRGLLMFRDELAGWFSSLDREYATTDRAFYLEAFNGSGSFVYDRIGRGTVHIEAATVSLLGGTQPGRLSAYLRGAIKGGAGDDGLAQRLQLLVWPDPVKWEHIDEWPNADAKREVVRVFEHLVDLNPEEAGATKVEYDAIPTLRFDDGGQEAFDGWYNAHMKRLRDEDLPPYLESHLAKYASLMPSLALIDHLSSFRTGPVTEESAIRAAAWCEYLESHAVRAYSPMVTGAVTAAERLLKKIKAGELGSAFTARDVYRKCWSMLTDIEDVREAIDLLVDYGWLVAQSIPTRGRSATIFEVSPAASKGGE